jgi:putative transposase
MRDQKKAEEIAVQRFQLISPLLAEGLDAGKAKQLKGEICRTSGLSERTIRRFTVPFWRILWFKAYRNTNSN